MSRRRFKIEFDWLTHADKANQLGKRGHAARLMYNFQATLPNDGP